jgi:hypothetical protein
MKILYIEIPYLNLKTKINSVFIFKIIEDDLIQVIYIKQSFTLDDVNDPVDLYQEMPHLDIILALLCLKEKELIKLDRYIYHIIKYVNKQKGYDDVTFNVYLDSLYDYIEGVFTNI